MALDEKQILNYVAVELQQSAGGSENDSIDADRQAALATYLGQPNGKESEGRSSIVSTDVADAIEWIMPEIIKAFTQNNEVVTFDPVTENDEDQAELESQYVYDILMKDNNGFLVIHQFVKDALMQKNGFIKVFYDESETVTTESYTGLTEPEYNIVLSDKEVEPIEVTIDEQDGIPIFDCKVSRTVDESKINVVSVPPEEFRISKQHNSVDVSTALFSAHVTVKTAGDLVAEGYSKELVDSIASSSVTDDDRDYRFYMQGETVYPDRDNSLDPALRSIEIAECYMRMDVDEDGIAELVKIEVAGGDNPDKLLSVEEIDEVPFISSTAILMSHKLFGLSIYDRLKQIQEQKTTLWRNIFDNMYLQNNQRTAVVENQVNLDDLMLSRPGGIVRVKRPDAIIPIVTPPLSGDSYRMMDYLDQVRAGRSGVSPEGPVTDNMIGDRVGSEGIEKMMSQKEELVGLMIRVIAETGIKPLCYLIRGQAIRHQDAIKDYKFRGNWVQVNPKSWRSRSHTTVRVGTGSGNRQEAAQGLTNILMMQEKIMANPGQALIKEDQVFNAINDFAKAVGLPGARKYLLDPKSPEGQENKKQVSESQNQQQQMQMQMDKAMSDAQTKIANAEEAKAQANVKNVDLTARNNQLKTQLDGMEIQADNEIAYLKQQLEEAKAISGESVKLKELDVKEWDMGEKHKIARLQIEATKEMAKDNNDNRQSKSDERSRHE